VVARKGEEDTECGVADGRGKNGGVVNGLHVATSDKAGLVLDDGNSVVTLDLVLLRAADNTHGRDEGNKMLGVLGREGRELLVGGKKPVGLIRALHGLFVGAGFGDWKGSEGRIVKG
jgi:hypothetical protein